MSRLRRHVRGAPAEPGAVLVRHRRGAGPGGGPLSLVGVAAALAVLCGFVVVSPGGDDGRPGTTAASRAAAEAAAASTTTGVPTPAAPGAAPSPHASAAAGADGSDGSAGAAGADGADGADGAPSDAPSAPAEAPPPAAASPSADAPAAEDQPGAAPTTPATPPAAAAPSAGDPGGSPGGQAGDVAAQVVAIVDRERAAAGCAPVTASAPLQALALAHSVDMAERDFFDHTNPDGASPGDRARAAGVSGFGAENIAVGQPDAASVMAAWMASPGHRANILNCDLTRLGVGHHPGPGGPWWTQAFGY